MPELSSFAEFVPYFILGVLVGIAITLALGAITLLRWQRTASELESQLRSHSFELQITLDELAELATDELSEMTGLAQDAASDLIMRARAHWFDDEA